MYRQESYLFDGPDLTDVLGNHAQQVNKEVELISKEQFVAAADEELFDHLSSKMKVNPIHLHEDKKEMLVEEIKVDVTGYFDRNPGGHDSVLAPGNRVIVTIPYTGDTHLWKCQHKLTIGVGILPANVYRDKKKDIRFWFDDSGVDRILSALLTSKEIQTVKGYDDIHKLNATTRLIEHKIVRQANRVLSGELAAETGLVQTTKLIAAIQEPNLEPRP